MHSHVRVELPFHITFFDPFFSVKKWKMVHHMGF